MPSAPRVSGTRCLFLAAWAVVAFALLAPGTAGAQLKGDVNANGRIDSGDALLALRIATDPPPPDPEFSSAQRQAADVAPLTPVQGNGTVDLGDAVLLMRAAANQDVDDDGLPTSVENGLGLSGLARNSDGMGLDDGALDSDRDGVSNRDEVAQGTDPGTPSAPTETRLPGPTLGGTLTGPSVLDPAVAYQVTTDLIVPAGASLRIPAGTRVQFSGNVRIDVRGGRLLVQGASGNEVMLTGIGAGAWRGIRIADGSSGNVLQYALVRNALEGVDLRSGGGLGLEVLNARFINDSGLRFTNGVSFGQGSSGRVVDSTFTGIEDAIEQFRSNVSEIRGNRIEGASSIAILMNESSSPIRGNTITNCGNGIQTIRALTPTITDNVVTGCAFAILLDAPDSPPANTPSGLIRNNNVHDNTTHLRVSDPIGPFVLDISGNWWGTTDPDLISARISSRVSGQTGGSSEDAPVAIFCPFLSAPKDSNPTLIQPASLCGRIATDIVVPAGQTTRISGPLVIDPGVRMTVRPGAQLLLGQNAGIFVQGVLVVEEGPPGSAMTTFTAPSPEAESGAWTSLEVEDGGVMTIANARIDQAVSAVVARGNSQLTLLRSSIVRAFNAGVKLGGSSFGSQPNPERIVGRISGNTIQGGRGIFAIDVAPPAPADLEISGNTLRGGLMMLDSALLFRGNTILQSFPGIHLLGQFRTRPIIDANQINVSSSPGILVERGATALISNNTIRKAEFRPTAGVQILDSSPELVGNDIRDAFVGISIRGRSSPVIRDGNVVTANEIGIRIGQSPINRVNPTPTIRRNSIFANDSTGVTKNFSFEGLAASTTPLDLTGNLFGLSSQEAILASFETTSGATIPVNVTGFLTVTTGGAVPADGISSTGGVAVRGASPNRITPKRGVGTTIGFSLDAPASRAIVRVLPLDGAMPLRVFDLGAVPAGSVYQVWDGRDGAGKLVASNGYRFAIEAQFPGGTQIIDPGEPAVFDADVDIENCFGCVFILNESNVICPFSNERLPLPVISERNVAYNYRVVGGALGPVEALPFLDAAEADTCLASGDCITLPGPHVVGPGTQFVNFDGRKADGSLHRGALKFGFFAMGTARPNFIIVESNEPQISSRIPLPEPGLNLPIIQVVVEPYRIRLSYDQVARVSYQLDQDSIVTLRLQRPGSPGATPTFITLLDGQLQRARDAANQLIEHTVVYDPYTDTPGLSNDVTLLEEGDYNLTLEARNPDEPDLVTTYVGVINIKR